MARRREHQRARMIGERDEASLAAAQRVHEDHSRVGGDGDQVTQRVAATSLPTGRGRAVGRLIGGGGDERWWVGHDQALVGARTTAAARPAGAAARPPAPGVRATRRGASRPPCRAFRLDRRRLLYP